jgi:hypothetical protein
MALIQAMAQAMALIQAAVMAILQLVIAQTRRDSFVLRARWKLIEVI